MSEKDLVEESVTEAAEPVAETAAEPVAETAAEPVAETAAEPVAETAAEPVAETAAEPVAETAAEPVAETAAEPVAETEEPKKKAKKSGQVSKLMSFVNKAKTVSKEIYKDSTLEAFAFGQALFMKHRGEVTLVVDEANFEEASARYSDAFGGIVTVYKAGDQVASGLLFSMVKDAKSPKTASMIATDTYEKFDKFVAGLVEFNLVLDAITKKEEEAK